jgi:hypothetical protein
MSITGGADEPVVLDVSAIIPGDLDAAVDASGCWTGTALPIERDGDVQGDELHPNMMLSRN